MHFSVSLPKCTTARKTAAAAAAARAGVHVRPVARICSSHQHKQQNISWLTSLHITGHGKTLSKVQQQVAHLSTQLTITTRQLQCATGMQSYLQQAEQHHKQQLQEVEQQLSTVKHGLEKTQQQLQEVSSCKLHIDRETAGSHCWLRLLGFR